MNKHLANLTLFPAKTNGPIGFLHSALKSWKEAHRLHKAERKRAEVLAELSPHILYDIGEDDQRPRRSTMPIWDNNPYRLLIKTMIDPRR